MSTVITNRQNELTTSSFSLFLNSSKNSTRSPQNGLECNIRSNLISPVVVPNLIIKLLLEFGVLFKVFICCHGAKTFLFHQKEKVLETHKHTCFVCRHVSLYDLSEWNSPTFRSWTSATSFSNLSDSFSDNCSASFNSTSCSSRNFSIRFSLF